VSRTDAGSRRTAVVAATTTWQDFPALWGVLLGEVWDCLHAGGIYHGCRNVMLYLDGVPNVEVGVLLDQPCPLTGRVVASALPAGTATLPPGAMTLAAAPAGGFQLLTARLSQLSVWTAGSGGWARSQVINVSIPYGSSG